IPDNAIGVIDVNLANVMKKVDVQNIDNVAFVKMARQELRKEDPRVSEIVDRMIKDPKSSGINLKNDMLFFIDEDQRMAIIAEVFKESKLESFLNECADLNKIKIRIDKYDGYKMADMEDFYVAYNNEVAIMIFDNRSVPYINTAMSLSKSSSLAANKNFNAYWKERKDVSAWMNFGSLIRFAEKYDDFAETLAESGLSTKYIDELKKGSVACNLDFDKGAIRFSVETQGIDSKIMKEYEQKFNSDLVKYMPEKSYLAFSYALKLNPIIDALAKDRDADVDVDEDVMAGMSIRQIVNSLGGSFVASIFDFVDNDQTGIMPLFAFAADIKDASLWRQLLDEARAEKKGDVYKISGDGFGFNLYVTLNDKAIMLTNSAANANKFVAGGYEKSMDGIVSKVKKGQYFYADLNISHYPVNVTTLIPDDVMTLLKQTLDYTEAIVDSKYKTEWSLYLADKSENSLLALIHFVDNNFMLLSDLAEDLNDALGNNDSYYTDTTEVGYVDEDMLDTVEVDEHYAY
nr:DUF4836 family protein [Bacteroidales bacterium]